MAQGGQTGQYKAVHMSQPTSSSAQINLAFIPLYFIPWLLSPISPSPPLQALHFQNSYQIYINKITVRQFVLIPVNGPYSLISQEVT